jgi:hypothetical protein
VPPDGRRKKQLLAGGFTIGQLCLVSRRSQAHEPNDDRRCADDSPLRNGHVLNAVADTLNDVGKESGDELHDCTTGIDRSFDLV